MVEACKMSDAETLKWIPGKVLIFESANRGSIMLRVLKDLRRMSGTGFEVRSLGKDRVMVRLRRQRVGRVSYGYEWVHARLMSEEHVQWLKECMGGGYLLTTFTEDLQDTLGVL